MQVRVSRPAPDAGVEPVPAIEIGGLRGTLLQAGRLFAESVVVPGVLLAVLLRPLGLPAAVAVAIGWCGLVAVVRWVVERRVPGTLLLCVSMFAGKGAIALAASSAIIYLLQPVLGSAVMALLFLGSAMVGRPVTQRLALDFVRVPAQLLGRRGVRRMFSHVAVLWGSSRLLDAAMSVSFLRLGLDAGLIARAVLSPLLTVLSVTGCAWWGWRALRREGVRVLIRRTATPPA